MIRLLKSLVLQIALTIPTLTIPALAAHAQDAQWHGPVAEFPGAPIFAPVVLPGTAEDGALREADYVQEEYFLSGAANIYREQADGTLAVGTPAVPYTTRLVILRPRDMARFNGVVQLGFSHPQFAGGQWGRIDTHVLRTGSAYALLAIGGDAGTRERSTPEWPVSTPLLLGWFAPARYGSLAWPQDDGIRWDVIGQASALLRQSAPDGPLRGARVERMYMSGWSFLGSTIRSWINFGFHDRYRQPDGSALFDGYLIGISAASVNAGHVPLNSADPQPDRRHEQLRLIDSPVIELTSEMEAITNVNPQRAQSDAVAGGYRIYELGGVSHRDSGLPGQARPATIQLQARLHPGVEMEAACRHGASDVPMRDIAQAALANLDRWVRTGESPPRADRLRVAEGGADFVRDAFGNPLGGIRVAQLDVPLVGYGVPAPADCFGGEPRRLLFRLPLAPEVLAQAYPGGRDDYLARFDARLDQLVAERWIMAEDALEQRHRARAYADFAFGPDSTHGQ